MIPRRQLLLGAALAATLGASWWAATLEQESPEAPISTRRAKPAAPAARNDAAPAATAPPPLAVLDAPRPPLPEAPALFEARSLQPPPPPPPPPPKPHAPALPFRFVGAVEDGGERAVFLLEGTQVRMVRVGEQLGSQYRVERITPASVEFIYLPLKERQILTTDSQ